MSVVQVESVPATVAVPLEPGRKARLAIELETVPPFWMFRMPVPLTPTKRLLLLIQVELAPSTVAVPLEPMFNPR